MVKVINRAKGSFIPRCHPQLQVRDGAINVAVVADHQCIVCNRHRQLADTVKELANLCSVECERLRPAVNDDDGLFT